MYVHVLILRVCLLTPTHTYIHTYICAMFKSKNIFSPVSSYTKVYFRPHAHADNDNDDENVPEFKDYWKSRMNEFKHLHKFSALGSDKLTVASLAASRQHTSNDNR